ncbi:MAG: hypothetical protein Q3962_08370 [Corynebacterium sp.]|nr:hypothetical protein [Corynebacterium sp.]
MELALGSLIEEDTFGMPLWLGMMLAILPALVVFCAVTTFFLVRQITELLEISRPILWGLGCALLPPVMLWWLVVVRNAILYGEINLKDRFTQHYRMRFS